MIVPACLCAQDCPNLVGGTEFMPTAGHESDYYYTVGDMAMVGPMGNSMATSAPLADSAHYFHTDSSRFVYAVTDSTPRLNKDYRELSKPALVASLDCASLTNLFTITVTSLKPGTTIKVTGMLHVLTSDLDDGEHYSMYGTDKKYSDWNAPNIDVGVTGDFATVALPYSEPDVPFEYEYTLTEDETYVTFIIRTGYNFKDFDAVAISDVKIHGCLNPKVISSQGKEICQGEQALFTLDKEYNAKSYLWEWSEDGGSSWTAISSKKSALQEVNKTGMVRCTMDGITSEPVEIKTVVCCEVNGMPASRKVVFHETFGYFPDARTYVDKEGNESALPANYPDFRTTTSFNLPMHDFDDGSGTAGAVSGVNRDGAVSDGLYAVVVPTPKGYMKPDGQPATWMNGVVSDNTSLTDGKPNGGALFINVNNTYQQATQTAGYSGPIFESVIDGLCSNKELYFETFVANLSGGQDPWVTLYIKDVDDPSIIYGAAENVVVAAGGGWQKISISDVNTPKSSVLLQVIADCGTRCSDGGLWRQGNDLIIDDIKFMTCSPPSISLYSDIETFAQDSTICADQEFEFEAPTSELLENYFGGKGKFKFLYQVSVDDGETWSNIAYIEDPKLTLNTADYPDAETMKFRIIVGSTAALDKFNADPNAVVLGDDCSDYSISEPFTITRAGDLNMGAPLKLAACGGETVTLKGSVDPSLVSWNWVKFDGTELTDISSDEALKDYELKVEESDSFYFVGYTADGCKGQRAAYVSMKSTVSLDLEVVRECGQTAVTAVPDPELASFIWVQDGDTLAETGNKLVFDTTFKSDINLTVKGVLDGFCPSDTFKLTTSVKALPDSVVPENVSLLKEDAKENISTLVAEPAEDCYLLFYTSETGAVGSKSLTQDKAVADTFVYWVSQVNADECESERSKFLVIVNDAPKPKVRDTAICAGESVADLSALVTKNDGAYVLRWYKALDDEVALEAAPSLSEAAPGEYKFYVSQQNTETQAESDIAEFSVFVYGVMDVEMEDIVLCANSEAEELSLENKADGDNFLMADGFAWYENGSEKPEAPELNTKVTQTTVYEYEVAQTYTLKSGAVCYGKRSPFTVTVNKEVVPDGSFNVNYLKTEAEANGGKFEDLLSKNPNVAVSKEGSELVWYDEDGSLIGEKAPAPVYDASVPVGTEEIFVYYVSQKDEYGCESEKKKVTVSVSSTPKPDVVPLNYCEGAVPASIETAASFNLPDGAAAEDYVFVWYDGDPENGGKEVSPADLSISTKLKNSDNVEEVTVYYVAQRTVKEPVSTSRASEINVTVYAKPVLVTETPDPVCEGSVDISNQWKVSNDVESVSVGFYDSDGTTDLDKPAQVGVSGTYFVRGYFAVPGTAEECSSELVSIKVQIDTLNDVSIDGSQSVCPNTTVSLKPVVGENNNPVSFEWTPAGVVSGDDYTSEVLAGPAGEEYLFELVATAGACTERAKHTVVIGDGEVSGSITVSEDNNSELDGLKLSVSSKNLEVFSCGGEVSLTAELVSTENDFVWKDSKGNVVGSGTSVVVSPEEGANVYTVEYTNECKTSVSIKINSIPLSVTHTNTDLEICEDVKFSAELDIDCDENPSIVWKKDGEVIDVNGASLVFNKAKASDSGLYSYVLTNRGCSASGELEAPLKVKPFIVAEEIGEHIVIREESLTLSVKMTTPETYPADIVWKDGGSEVATGQTHTFVVEKDYDFTVELSDPDYCSAEISGKVLADAKLSLKVSLEDSICVGESAKLVIDTTGTGKFIDKSKMKLTVMEVSDGAERPMQLSASSDGELYVSVTPAASAEYVVTYIYRKGEEKEQLLDTAVGLFVAPAVEIVVPDDVRVCSGDEAEIVLKRVYPEGVVVEWSDDASIKSVADDGASAIVAPVFDGVTDVKSVYTYTLTGKYKFCQPKEFEVKVIVDKPLEGKIEAPEAVCEGSSLTIDASSYAAEAYVWSSDALETEKLSSKISVTPAETATFELSMERGLCKATDRVEVLVNSKPVILSVDSVGYRDVEIVLDPSLGTAPFLFAVDVTEPDNNARKTDLAYAPHVAKVIDAAGCEAVMDFVVVPPAINPPVMFSPNGDGENDAWSVPGFEETYPDAVIVIFDRFGKKLLEMKGSDGGWDGTYNGQDMPATDYWYEINVDEVDKVYVGHFTLVRN